MTEMAMENPSDEGLKKAIEKADRYWPHVGAEKVARSEVVQSAVATAREIVEDEKLRPPQLVAATESTTEAVALAAISREVHGEPQLTRQEIAGIKEFIRWIFNGLWDRE